LIRKTIAVTIFAAALAACAAALAESGDPKVPFPQGYRRWTFLHGTLIGPTAGSFAKKPCEKPCTGGVLYFYANGKAMEGFRTGKFPEGSVIADEVLEMHGRDGGTATEGPRRAVGVMVKDKQRYAATGGWGYASFDGDSQVDENTAAEKKACFDCHVPRKDQDYVFTQYHDR
jgi:cytochrome P460